MDYKIIPIQGIDKSFHHYGYALFVGGEGCNHTHTPDIRTGQLVSFPEYGISITERDRNGRT